ncbi:Gfo/Idh/MocA family protein [Novosphingobium mangrovi (ex Huang et al. 2023)]|uniref:Gfo/Idh/MocA family oxidoreductase n=1 Tax=Novosphingobium mangrovi (ex Huang et al. 2023) TaxID=2976432 RepID=A0ABT2IAH4_9SPHN|nr:Gfo/Idh/MocA family oxidoreductase [Novosphingobium mangrovi (ex Huang et al. 2023)]MCT2401502.1 Gfo/Idh/MocA family oxidoreductase [Novosphingobium mangrovi (ex Huang et al. 2023)]
MSGGIPRVALSGCGAVARLYYAPALRVLEERGVIAFVAAFDPNEAAVRAFVSGRTAVACSSFAAIFDHAPDLVIVASPPAFHREQVMEALGRKVAVHCEKPLAPDMDSARAMTSAAEAHDRPVFAGMIRRHLPAARMIRDLLGAGALGPLTSIDIFEGGPFDWPIESPRYFTAGSGNGPLEDIGTHCLDLLCWWMGTPDEIAYEDDAMGGTPANCAIALRFGDCAVRVRISRDWYRPNRYALRGAKGWISWEPNDGLGLQLGYFHEDTGARIALRQCTEQAGVPRLGRPADDFMEAFVTQLHQSVLGLSGAGNAVALSEALEPIGLIEECRRVRRAMVQPWLEGARP